MTDRRPSGESVVVLYHRPVDDPFHGGSLHCRGFVNGLRRRLSVAVIAPNLAAAIPGKARDKGSIQLAGLRYLIKSAFRASLFLLLDGTRPKNSRTKVLVAFDVYSVGLAAIWSRIRDVRLVYYPQDSNKAVTQSWKAARTRGAFLFRVIRAPGDRLGLAVADLVVVPSESMKTELVLTGLAPERVKICTLKREVPVYDRERVNSWRDALGLDRRIGIIFVGSFEYPPNVRAYEFIRTALAPSLLASAPEAILVIAGKNSDAFSGGSPNNVRVLGTVPDLDSLLFACPIGIAPMDVTGGTSGKIADYLLHGLRVIATPEASEGVRPSHLLHTVPKAELKDALLASIREVVSGGMPYQPRGPDEESIEIYTGTTDVEAVATEINRWLSRPV